LHGNVIVNSEREIDNLTNEQLNDNDIVTNEQLKSIAIVDCEIELDNSTNKQLNDNDIVTNEQLKGIDIVDCEIELDNSKQTEVKKVGNEETTDHDSKAAFLPHSNHNNNNRFLFKLKQKLNLPLLTRPLMLTFLVYGFLHYAFMMSHLVFVPKILIDRGQEQDSVASILAMFGVGGIVGTLVAGPLMAFGCFRQRKFLVFLLDNLLLAVLAGKYKH
jgi:uncharacterized membrane protein